MMSPLDCPVGVRLPWPEPDAVAPFEVGRALEDGRQAVVDEEGMVFRFLRGEGCGDGGLESSSIRDLAETGSRDGHYQPVLAGTHVRSGRSSPGLVVSVYDVLESPVGSEVLF